MELTKNTTEKTAELEEVDFDPFAGPTLTKIASTTQSQLEIWLACMIGGDDASRSYNESISLSLKGDLNQKALQQAFEKLQQRHEMLRSTFSPDGKSICVYDEIPLQLDFQDISSENKEAQKTIVQNLHQQDAELSFDLVKGPLLRTYLVKLDTQEFILKISAHHIICDGWSFGIILENLSALYNSLMSGEELNLEEPIPYSVYAQELSEHTASANFREIEHYWLEQYREDVPVLNLPTDQVRPQTRTYKSQRSDFPVSKDIIASLKNLATQKKTSLITALIAAFESYLHLLTKQNDIVLGLPASGQSATGNYELVGHCVNLLPLRTKIKGDESFLDYLELRMPEIMDAYDHQQFTFSSLLQKLNVARDSSRVPLVPVIFNVDMGMDANVEFKGLSHELFSDPRAYENFEIFLNITGTEEKLIFEWSYNSNLFKPKSIEKMMNEFQGLLEELIENPTVKIKDIHTSGNNSLVQQYKKWNNTTVAYPKNKTVADLVNETAIKYPTKTAIYFDDQEINYTQLNKKSNQIAHNLINLGAKEDDVIALIADRTSEMIIILLGIIKSGATYLPIDPQYPNERIEFMLADSRAKYLIVSHKYEQKFSTIDKKIVLEDLLITSNNENNTYIVNNTKENRLAYVLYTSGSTGKPKGVEITHRSLMNLLVSLQKSPGITTDDILLAVSTISFDIAATELYLPLISGASIYLADSNTAKDGRLLVDIIRSNGITIMQATPMTWRMMLAADWTDKLPLKIISTGEALPKNLADTLFHKGIELWNGYGPTETTIWSSVKQITNLKEPITIGKPIANTQIYILDENFSPVSLGCKGEIYIAGDGVAKGYRNRPDLTDERFLANPFKKGTKIYRTGDIGYYTADGEIICVGRSDDQVKISGHRIELSEIEHCLINQKGVKDAIVSAHPETDGLSKLVAYIIPDERDYAGWKERWDTQYSLAIEKEKNLSIEQQNIDIAIIHNNQIDAKEHGREWVQETLKRIKEIKATRILELGAGGGHLMFELAQSTDRYVASDYSEVAINKLNEKLTLNPKKWHHVRAFAAAADDFTNVKNEQFDLVLLHSVAQYFPNLEYLLKVIERSVEALHHGGCIFIGDLQTKESINLYFAHDQLSYAQDKLSIKEYRKAVNYRLQTEEELSVDPAFFYSLSQLLPSIKAVDVQIRGGEYPNEPTKSHYDVWLYVGDHSPQIVNNDLIRKWEDIKSIDELTKLLTQNRGQTILVQDILNQRVQIEYEALQFTDQLDGHLRVVDLKKHINKIDKIEFSPRDLWILGNKLGFQTHIRWANDGADGKIEAVFLPKKYHGQLPQIPSGIKINKTTNFLSGNESPYLIDIPLHQIQIWKNNLRESIPEYMVPSYFTAINRFPKTDNGKIDRKNLPLPVHKLGNNDDQFIPPRNSTEEDIAAIWLEHLKLDKISVNSNFFESGGHSLTAVRVMLAIEKKYGKKLPISVLFENSTIEKLAQLVTETPKKTKWHSLVPIKTTGTKKPIYLVHGGGFNVLTFEPFSKHMDPEQPIYALQGLGLYDKTKMLSTIEAIAAFYIREMLELDPVGPYALGGYCSGGVIAYEMATQLRLQGKKVSFLAMLDSTYDGSRFRPSRREQFTTRTQEALYLIKSSTKHPRLIARLIKNKLIGLPIFAKKNEISLYENEINKTYHEAFVNYSAQPLDIKICLLKARTRIFFIKDSVSYGWRSLALKGVQVHEMEGNHHTFLTSPNERTFAKKLQALIDENT